MRVILESGWAVRISYANNAFPDYWLKTANGTSNKKQIKVYSSERYARRAAHYYPLPEDAIVNIVPVEVSVEMPDNAAPF